MSSERPRHWPPAIILVVGVCLLFFVRAQVAHELRQPLTAALPAEVEGMPGTDVPVSDAEAKVAGFTDYAFRVYASADTTAAGTAEAGWASIYMGFYDEQSRGRTIHSPQNCLPGAGWEALSSEPATLTGNGGESFTVNRYILQKDGTQALVLYWYQGRGRVAHNEYLVKWNLLRDAALRRRTDEALVRIVVPMNGDADAAFGLAKSVALRLKPALDQALPG